jgi:hypothetical protein
MRRFSAVPLLTASMVCLALTACVSLQSTSPFPSLGSLSFAEEVQVIQSRTTGLRTLAAVVTMSVSGKAALGTFDMVVNYDASGKMRFTALKDLLISTRPIFDLIFAGERYSLTLYENTNSHARQDTISRFVQDNPEFRAFLLLGEVFFLPGFDGHGNSPVFRNMTASQFTTQLRSGAKAQWFAKPETLEVTKARVTWKGEHGPVSFRLQYRDYRKIGAYYIPGRVTLKDLQLGIISQALLKQIEINMPLARGTFDISSPTMGPSPIDHARKALTHIWWRMGDRLHTP